MNTSFQGKVALITGSSQGIGKAIALELGSRGARIALNGRNNAKLEAANLLLRQSGITTLMVPGDVTDLAVCNQIISRIILEFGRLDILVTNAGITAEANFADMSAEHFKLVVDSLFYGSVFPVKAAFPELTRSKGHVILISSLAGLHGLRRYSAYCSGKMALTGFAHSLQAETHKSGVHIGIAYVGLTQNDPEKKMLNSQGDWLPVPQRPRGLQKSPETVARGIAGMIIKRRKRKIFSTLGRIQALMIRITPSLFRMVSIKL